MAGSAEHKAELEALEQMLARRARVQWVVGGAVAALVLVAMLIMLGRDHLDAMLRGETDWLGQRQYEPPFPTDPTVLAGIDLQRVHETLLPGWVVAQAHADTPWGHERADGAFDKLREAIASDQNLEALAGEMRRVVTRGRLVEDAGRLYFLAWAWSEYLDRNGHPYWVQGNVMSARGSAFFYVKVYRTLHDLAVTVGNKSYRARVITRLDDINVTEVYLGATSKDDDGAFVLAERVREFAADRVWPMLDARLDERLEPGQRVFADAVRREAAAALPPEHLALLQQTAHHRAAILDRVEAIRDRADCGSEFVITEVPWDGFTPFDFTTFERFAASAIGSDCPDVTELEADVLVKASRSLQQTEDLGQAIGALAAFLARGIVLHEARHVADDAEVDGLETPLRCFECPESMPASVRAEISAYLATFAWSEAPATALFQVCSVIHSEAGSHGHALGFILDRLDHDCADGMPADLRQRARQLEASLFGRSDRIALPRDFPERLGNP